MKTKLECFPCLVKQILDVARFTLSDENDHNALMRKMLVTLSKIDMSLTPPELAYTIQCAARQCAGTGRDVYRDLKVRSTELALKLFDDLRDDVVRSETPLKTAAIYAIAANIIDFGVAINPDYTYFETIIRSATSLPWMADWEDFVASLQRAERVLYLADNAGEIVFDRLLIEQIGPSRVTMAVKSLPILNDAVMQDAQEGGLLSLVHTVETGSGMPGTVIHDCSDEFRNIFYQADMIISKGQANYETLSEKKGNIFYCLKVKCPVIGDDIGAPQGTLVVKKHRITKG